jgi:uncharacterized repeat protein (TIGR01451 family)
MKTLKALLLAMVITCCGYVANAQLTCGVHANYWVSLNPNNIPVFHDSSTVSAGWSITSHYWSFGDGTTSNLQNPSHVFSGPGPFNVCLYVTAQLQGSNIFCTDTFCHSYTNCNNMVVATATAQVQSGGIVVYTGIASSNYLPLTYSWSFPGGTPSTSTTPITTVQYANNGSYTACFTATDTNGCSATDCVTANVTNAPCANIHASFNQQTTTNGITLTSTSTGVGTGTQYQWYMDSIAISTISPNTSFTLTGIAAGYHQFCLKVFAVNSTAPCDDTCKLVYIPGNGPCGGAAAGFVYTTANGSISVSAGNTYPAGTTFQWWLDGQSTAIAPNYSQYSWQNLPSGQHQVCLYLYYNGAFCDSVCQYITTTGNIPCTGNMNGGFTSAVQGNSVTFTGFNNPNGTVYHWTFGDGTATTTNGPSVVHLYATNPNTTTYFVCLKVTVPGTTCIDSSCQYVVVQGTGSGCQAYFTWASTANGTITFTNLSNTTGTLGTYYWSFGDGSNSTVENPVHSYNALGNYMVCLIVSTSNGCTSTYCDTVYAGGCNLGVTIAHQTNGALHYLNAITASGMSPYYYTWSNGQTNQGISVTAAGTYCVTATDGNQCTATACYTVTNNYSDTICGVAFYDANGNGVQDSTETGIPGAEIHIGNYTTYADSFGHYSISVPAGVYSVYYCAPTGYSYTIPISPNANALTSCAYYYQVVINGGGAHCGYNFGVQNNSVSICGIVFFDANNNGVQDQNTEGGLSGVHVYVVSSAGATYHAYTNSNGEYCVTVPAGAYTIHITSNSIQSCSVTPQTITLTTVTGQSYPNQNFAVYCQPGLCNLKIDITPHTTVTPGFPAWYSMHISNVGTSVASGTANFFYDPVLTFNYASPVQTSHNASTHTVSFNVTNLLPGQSLHYYIYFNANPPLNIGQFVFTLANINPDVNCNDVNLTNNVDTIHQAVTASWDPNNKLAYVTNYDNPQYHLVSSVEPNQRIQYVINFQNTGTSPAVNVVVEDLISSDLDFSSFEFLGSSHPCIVTTVGNKLNFKFSNIMLPDSNSNEAASHGFVKFAMNAVNGLAGGHVISDDAAIYFDYNDPVITNDAAVILLEPNGIEDVAINTTVVIAPNPMKDYTEVIVRGNNSGFTFRVTDITGRVVAEEKTSYSNLKFGRETLASGIYVYQIIQNNKPVAQGKLVIE